MGNSLVSKLGDTHILFRDTHRHRKVEPIASLRCEQGMHGSENEYHVGSCIVSKAVFEAAIECLANKAERKVG